MKTASYQCTIIGALCVMMFATTSNAVSVPVHESDTWKTSISVDISWKDLKSAAKSIGGAVKSAWNHVATRDPERQEIFEIQGKKVVIVQFMGPRDTRITSNINFDPAWRQSSRVRVLVANVPEKSDPCAMAFQQKYDEDWGSDPNIGPVMRHGDVVANFNPGHGRYLARRTETVYPGAIFIFADADIAPAELAKLPGVRVLK